MKTGMANEGILYMISAAETVFFSGIVNGRDIRV